MSYQHTLLDKERKQFSTLNSAFLIAGVSGFITYYLPGHGVWQQWCFLLHSIAGVFLALVLTPYIYFHVKRTLGLRRFIVSLTGISAASVLIGLTLSGLYISVVGQTEKLRWIFGWHIILAFCTVALLLIHLAVHALRFSQRQRATEKNRFQTLSLGVFRSSLFVGLFSACFVLFATLLYSVNGKSYVDQPAVKPYELPYGNHPFRPSETETIDQKFVDARQVGGSLDCASCHAEIAEQWRASIHSLAASDKAYVKNISLLADKKGIAATRYCEGCHAPIALLSGQLTTGGKHGGVEGTSANEEGVSCMGCHGIDQVMHLNGVASYLFVPNEEYLFSGSQQLFAKKIHNFLIRIHPHQHRQDMARDVLSSPTLCASCHAQFMDKEVNQWGWVKMQDDYTSWLNSPFSGQSEQSFSHHQIQRCQDCHMPLTPGIDPSANKNGLVVSHRTLGANTVIPWLNGDQEQLVLTQEFLQAGKIKVTIEKPRKHDAVQSEYFVGQKQRLNNETPSYLYLGDSVTLNVSVANLLVGHNFPGGTTDINEVWIEFRVFDAQNKVIFESGMLSDTGDVDEKAHFYRSIPVDRYGKEVWRHDLFNMTGNVYVNTIASGESDIVPYTFSVPYWAESPIVTTAVVKYRKFNDKYAKWALDDPSVAPPVTEIASDVITVPLRFKSPVEKDTGKKIYGY